MQLSLVPIIAAVLVTAADTAIGSVCRDDWLCVEEVREGNGASLYVRNLEQYPVTYTLQVRGAAIDGDRTITETLAPLEQHRALTVPADDGQALSIDFEWTVGNRDANHDDDYVYGFPYAAGRTYRVLQGYGSRFSHRGREEYAVDFDMPVGTPVHAARDGIVARVVDRHDKGCWKNGCGAYANFIVVLHSDGTTGEYYHLEKDGALVASGDRVRRGQLVGYSGNTGHTAMPHLHFAVYRATSWGHTQSIPVLFESADGIIDRPRMGARHEALH